MEPDIGLFADALKLKRQAIKQNIRMTFNNFFKDNQEKMTNPDQIEINQTTKKKTQQKLVKMLFPVQMTMKKINDSQNFHFISAHFLLFYYI